MGRRRANQRTAPVLLPVRDLFDDARPGGRVVGSRSSDGTTRYGVDRHRRLSVDGGALRIGQLPHPGWGQAAVTYGPVAREQGAALAVFMLNGHHASQTDILRERHRHRVRRWLRQLPRPELHRRQLRENLAVGWFPDELPSCPPAVGNAFVVRTADPENGELLVRVSGRLMPVVRGLRNLPMYFVVAARDGGAAYYASSLAGAAHLPAHPALRPLGVDTTERSPLLHGSVHQGVLGEVGFGVDSRVYGVAADVVDGLAPCVDAPDGARAASGWRMDGPDATVDAGGPAGLVHAVLDLGGAEAGLVWRGDGGASRWQVRATRDGWVLEVVEDGVVSVVATDPADRPSGPAAVQVLDDGEELAVYADGIALFAGPVSDGRLANGSTVGVTAGPGASAPPEFRAFEAHPRTVPLPPALDVGSPWHAEGTVVEVCDPFDGPGGDLDGSVPRTGPGPWRRVVGVGVIERTGEGAAKVRADVGSPNPGRTLYVTPWPRPELADVSTTFVPPGRGRGEGHNGRGGVVLWQDEGTFLVVSVWLDDVFDGAASLSSFLSVGGREDLFRAVWTNVGASVQWGREVTLRVVSDGVRWTASIDGRPVLHRAFADVVPGVPRVALTGVGIAANWEYGDDTGTVFRSFAARSAGGRG